MGHACCVRHQSARGGREPALNGGVECGRAGMLRLQRQAGWTVSTYEEGEAVVGPGLPAGGALTSGAASGGYFDELFKYSTATMTWTQLDAAAGVTGTAPSARYEHSMTTVGEDLYVFGGYGGEAGGVEGRIGCVRHQSAGGTGRCWAGRSPLP